MPRNAGNCDYTHFIFYILKPQGISLREQSPISSMAAEQIENSTSAEQGWGFAWRETNRDLTDVSRLCGPSWHLGKTLASFSRCFLLCYFLTFWITHPDSYGKKKNWCHTYKSVIRKLGDCLWQVWTCVFTDKKTKLQCSRAKTESLPFLKSSNKNSQPDNIQPSGSLCQNFPLSMES